MTASKGPVAGVLLLFFFAHAAISQQDIAEKASYLFTSHTFPKGKELYASALDRINLDKYRYLNRRNTIRFEDGVEVLLFSAAELFEKYNKQVSPLTLDDDSPFSYSLRLSDDGKIEEIAKKSGS